MHGAEIGTLEPGKLADIVIIDGDPLRDSNALLNVVTTIKGGQVVFERQAREGRREVNNSSDAPNYPTILHALEDVVRRTPDRWR